MTPEIISSKNLTKRYGGFIALDNLNLEVSENSCVGLLGPNGAGKSTYIKILTGLIRPSSGKAALFGYDVSKDLKNALANVGAVVETPRFPSNLTPKEVLHHFGMLRGMPKNEINSQTSKALQTVKMEEWSDKKIGKFSKGMKQRVALASAVLHDPDLIILDEPASGLDPRGVIEIRDIIKSFKKEGKTIFLSSHLLSETQEICDTVAFIDKGKLLHYDRIDSLEKKSTTSKMLIEFINPPSQIQIEKIAEIDFVNSVKKENNNTVIVEYNGKLETRADLLDQILKIEPKIITYKSLESNLENLYMDLVSDSVG